MHVEYIYLYKGLCQDSVPLAKIISVHGHVVDYEHHINSYSNRATADTRTKKTFNNNNVLISLSNDAPTFA